MYVVCKEYSAKGSGDSVINVAILEDFQNFLIRFQINFRTENHFIIFYDLNLRRL